MVLNIITSGVLVIWGIFAMSSPMMFNGSGAMNKLIVYKTVLGVLYFPCYLFLAYWILGWTYYNYSAALCLLVSLVVVSIFCSTYILNLINLLRGILPEGYSKVSGKIYYDAKNIIGADFASFVILSTKYTSYHANSDYAADKNHVYIDGSVLADAQPHSFQLIDDRLGLWADHQNVFCFACKVAEADPKNITIVDEDSDYWHDQRRLFFRNTLLEVAEATLSIKFAGLYLVSKHNVYYEGKLMAGADPASFHSLKNTPYIAVDKNRAYYQGEILQAEGDSFQLIAEPYSRDAKHLFYKHRTLATPENFDLDSFHFLEDRPQDNIAYDNNHIYFIYRGNLKVIAKNLGKKMQHLGGSYVVFNDGIFYIDTKISLEVSAVEGANLETFSVMNRQRNNKLKGKHDASDKYYLYKCGKRAGQNNYYIT